MAEDVSIRDLLHDQTFLIVVTTSVLASAGVNLISPALPALAAGLKISDGQAGLLITAFVLPSILVLPVAGYLSDRIGRHAVMAAGAVLIGIGGLLSFIVTTFWPIIMFRVLQGIGFASVMPMTVAMIGDLFDDRKETTAQGVRTSFNKGASIGWMVLGGLITVFGWQYLFLVYVVCIPLGLLLYLYIPPQEPNQQSILTYLTEMTVITKEPKMTLYLSIGFVRFFLKYGLITFLPLLMAKRYGLVSAEIGAYMAVIGAAGILSAAMAGNIDARYRKTSSVFIAFLLIGVAYTVIATIHSLIITVVMLAVFGLADAAMSPLHKSLLTHNVDHKHRGGVIAANSLGQNLGKTLGPLTLSLLVFTGYTTLFLAAGSLALFSAVNYFYLRSFLASRNLYP